MQCRYSYAACIEKELSASKCSSFYRQSGLETFLPLSNALRLYSLGTKPNIQLWKEIRSENEGLDLKENYWRLSVRHSTWKHCCRHRTLSRFTCFKPNPTFNSDRKLGSKTKYLLWKRTTGAQVFVVLPSIRPRNFSTAIERVEVLRAQKKPQHSTLAGK